MYFPHHLENTIEISGKVMEFTEAQLEKAFVKTLEKFKLIK
jgi:hypothetical protein